MSKPIYKEIEITKIIDLMNVLSQYPSLEFFRGQSNAEWTLTPKISRLFLERDEVPDTWERIESFIMSDFKQYAIPHIKRDPKNDFEWLVLGQHYGLPTRLLDWSSNPLKAAFFAVCDDIENEDGALFAFTPMSLIPMLQDYEDIDYSHVISIFPNMIDTRIVVQESCFTAFPIPQEREKFIPLEDANIHNGVYYLLLKIVIPRDKKTLLLRELNFLAVNHRTLFPDLSGLSDHINWRFKHNFTEFGP